MDYNGMGELAYARRYTNDACTNEEVVLAQEYFTFAPDGRALELVSGNASRTESDWVWLDGQPVAQFTDSYDAAGTYQGTTVTYLYADHLGTPRIGTDASKAITWRYQSDAFGVGTPSGTASVRLRMPGQIDLGILGIGYNYFRDYDPQVGRYVQSDPIGLDGGINTYAYAGNNPISFVDPTGESPLAIPAAEWCLSNPACAVPAGAATGVALTCLINPDLCKPAVALACEDVSQMVDEFLKPLLNQDKKLTPSEIKKLKGAGIDPERLKGSRHTGARDLYKDKKGNIKVKPKDGSGPGEDTGINIKDL